MKALVFHGPRQLQWEDIPEPEVSPGEVIVEVRAVGLCGSDIHGYTGENPRRTPGLPMGHEAAGQVVKVGQNVSSSWLGRRVALLPMLPCGWCDQCLADNVHRCRNRRFLGNNYGGAMAEKIVLPVANLYPLPEGLSYAHGALAEPLSVAIHAVRQAGDLAGRTVLIAGAGPIGLLTLAVAVGSGAKGIAVTVRTPSRQQLALSLGAVAALDPSDTGWREEMAQALGSREVEVAFDAAGIAPTFQQALDAAGLGATVVAIGAWSTVPLNLQRLVPKELRLVGTFNCTPGDFAEAVEWLGARRLDPRMFITETLDLAQGAEAFERLANHPSSGIKSVLTLGDDE